MDTQPEENGEAVTQDFAQDPGCSAKDVLQEGAPAHGFSRAGPLHILSRCLTWSMPIKDLSGVMVHPVLYLLDLLLGYAGKVRSFGEESPDHTVVVLIGAFLPCCITVTVEDPEPFSTVDGLDQTVVLHEFRSIVCGDGLELCPHNQETDPAGTGLDEPLPQKDP